MTEKFDAIIIGTGQSGPSLAARMTKEGLKTAIIERKLRRQSYRICVINRDVRFGS